MKTLRIFFSVLLISTTATAAPCVREHVATTGKPSACSGVLSPAQTALQGAQCVDDLLPTCRTLRRRDATTHARRVAMLARDASETSARADRWQALALAPRPVAPPVTVVRETGLPSWAVGVIAAGSALLGGWVAWQVRGNL